MKIFLKLKHWQLFLIWIIAEILFFTTSRSSLWLLTFELFGFTVIGWIYSIGKVINSQNEMNRIKNYKEDIWLIIYLISIIPLGLYFKNLESFEPINGYLIFIAGTLGFFSMIKLVNFSAKVLKQYERKTELKLSDYTSEFFLIMIMILGVWIIQPRLNKIIEMK